MQACWSRAAASLCAVLLAVAGRNALAQQLPLAPVRATGQSVTPAFEGWYKNADGTFSLSFGYYNRNSREVLDIPVGSANFIAPGDSNQGQPTRFDTGRHWGVFAVKVPADFGDKNVVWTVTIRGETYAIPGSLKRNWEIDALQGEAGSGNTPPKLKFDTGPEAQGPGGATVTMSAKVGVPLPLSVLATDDGRASGSVASAGRSGGIPTLTWFVHQGAGEVKFAAAAPRVDRASNKAETTATFSEPGVYILRLRANDASGVAGAGHSQCCWSNAFVKVNVSR